MTIHLRTVVDDRGDTVDNWWYCSYRCFMDDIAQDEAEEGGAYPCGAESDYPEACATCGECVGHPLTPEGESYAREMAASDTEFGRSIRETYKYIFN